MDEFSTPQFSKMISNANDIHDNYQRILGPYPYDAPLGFCWFPNGWKLKWIESSPTNVSLEQLFLNKVKPIQKKQKKRIEWNLTYELRQKIQTYCLMYNLIPWASYLSYIGRWGLSIIGYLNINSIHNKFEMLCQ